MNKKVDVRKVDAALKRAARAAMSGDDEQRSGRLIVRETDSGRFVSKDKKRSTLKKV